MKFYRKNKFTSFLTIQAEVSLYEFLKQAWPYIEGNTPFIESFHIEAICEHLEACFHRDIRNLLVNVPPRSSKTSTISIAFVAWVWIHNPQEKFMYASYAGVLSLEHSLKCRRLIESDWYQQRWRNRYQLAKDQNAKGFFENNKGGYRIATSVGAASTGRGASILIGDDLNGAGEVTSQVKRDSANQWLSQVWSTRLNNPKTDIKIIVQQRIHEKDISGYILANDLDKDWTRLILPMEFEVSRKSQTYIDNKLWWEDPRKEEGELLSPERFSSKEIERYKQDLGSYGYAGQYQQRPSPLGGGIIKKDWFKKWIKVYYPTFQLVIQSWDCGISDSPTASYSACTTWGVFVDDDKLYNIILLSQWRGRVGYPELRKRAERLYVNFFDTEQIKNNYVPKRNVDKVLIEAKATGDPLIRDLRIAGVPAIGYEPKGDKESRVQRVSHFIETGLVWMPTIKDNPDKLMSWAEEFIEEAASFPNASSRDLVDSMTQCFSYLRDYTGMLGHKKQEDYYQSPRRVY